MADGQNVLPGVPKAAYTPAKGHLVHKEFAQANEWDLCANGEVPEGLIESTNSGNGTISVIDLRGGATLILEHDGSCVLGQSVQATATALGTVIARTTVKTAAPGAGLPIVTALNPRGTNTVEVYFP
jgi:hypothetical protein